MYKILFIILHLEILCANGNMMKERCKIDDNVKMTCYDYIPNQIPDGITRVIISDLQISSVRPRQIEQTNFSSMSWSKIETLELSDLDTGGGTQTKIGENCFKNLKSLKQLHLNISASLYLSLTSFVGLESVTVLDTSGCSRICAIDFLNALNVSNTLPALNTLKLPGWQGLRGALVLDKTFVQTLLPRNITTIDLSHSQISEFDISAVVTKLKTLEVLNASYTISNKFSHKHVTQDDIKHIKLLDFSHVTLPKNIVFYVPGILKIFNITSHYDKLNNALTSLLTPETVNISGVIPYYTSVWIDNCVLIVNKDQQWLVKTLVIRNNNLHRLNIELVCNDYMFSSIETLDISENGMEYLHPSFLTCVPNIVNVDMSKNNMYKMAEEDFPLFETMFIGRKYLKTANLSGNKLHNIPLNLFHKSKNIEIIDLSFNELDQVTFTLSDLDNLRVFDLRGNKIQTLNSVSLSYLNSLLHGDKIGSNTNLKVILKDNPLSCSRCETKYFIQWLLSTKQVDIHAQGLRCSNENNEETNIDSAVVKSVQRICDRKILIISCSISTSIIVIVVVSSVVIFYRRNKNKKQKRNQANVLKALREGEGKYEFVVFLAYSNNDEDIVNAHILQKLNEILRLMTGIDRDLVCTGDRAFRPGFYVHNETYRQLDKAAVMCAAVSNNFCLSDYCRNELDQAYVKRKPIVLMFIEHVNEEAMTPTLKELYRRNVRVLWTVEDGQYVLKTSWDNVCTSILDLIKFDE